MENNLNHDENNMNKLNINRTESIISYSKEDLFNNFTCSRRLNPSKRQKWFSKNLADLINKNKTFSDYKELLKNTPSTFKINPNLDEVSVGKMNIMMKELCSLPTGIKLVKELFDLLFRD